jgi:two-component system, cell cycle response regulator
MDGRSRTMAGPAGRMTVLVVEADAAQGDVLMRTLAPRFGRVVAAGTVAEALELHARIGPDLAVVGAVGPGGATASLVVALRQASRRLPIFLAGRPEDILGVLSHVSLPGLRILTRPFDPVSLAEALEDTAQDLAARRSVGEAWRLVRFFLDESPQPAVVFNGEEAVSVNRAFLRFMGLASIHELRSRGLALERYVADPLPAGGLSAFARSLVDDPLDREHHVRLANPDRPDLPPHMFQALAARLPGRDSWLITLTDITELELERRELLDLANLDALTRIFNRRKLEEILAEETARANRYAMPLAVIMLDIDHFKVINDTHGHDAGDAVLAELATRLGKAVRQVDRLARFGGEEFVVVAPGITLEAAVELAERLRLVVVDETFVGVGRVTVSLGVAEIAPGESAEAVLKRADEALYRAKAGGRNQVESGTSPQLFSR